LLFQGPLNASAAAAAAAGGGGGGGGQGRSWPHGPNTLATIMDVPRIFVCAGAAGSGLFSSFIRATLFLTK